jgi:hypothetical protein
MLSFIFVTVCGFIEWKQIYTNTSGNRFDSFFVLLLEFQSVNWFSSAIFSLPGPSQGLDFSLHMLWLLIIGEVIDHIG